jgi:hypothetical protein
MNGYNNLGRNPYGAEAERQSPPRTNGPNRRLLVEGYRKGIMNNFEKEAPRYNPVCPSRSLVHASLGRPGPILMVVKC